jgi:hypothetical protein
MVRQWHLFFAWLFVINGVHVHSVLLTSVLYDWTPVCRLKLRAATVCSGLPNHIFHSEQL